MIIPAILTQNVVEAVAPVRTITNPKDLVDQEDELLLMQVGLNLSAGQWIVGEIANRIIGNYDMIVEQNLATVNFGTMQIYSYIASLCGKGVSSIRRYAAVAKFYSQEDRDLYCLSFSHFSAAMAYPTRWKELLAACVEEQNRRSGRMPPSDWIKVYADQNYITDMEAERMTDTTSLPLWLDDAGLQDNGGDAAVLQPDNGDNTSHISKKATARFIPYLLSVKDTLYRFAAALPVSESLKDKFAKLMLEFEMVLGEIQLELKQVDNDPKNML